jgi:hypothetical protein
LSDNQGGPAESDAAWSARVKAEAEALEAKIRAEHQNATPEELDEILRRDVKGLMETQIRERVLLTRPPSARGSRSTARSSFSWPILIIAGLLTIFFAGKLVLDMRQLGADLQTSRASNASVQGNTTP